MLPARLQRAYGVIYTFEPMGKPIGYNPARLQRAYLPIMGIERIQKRQPFRTAGIFAKSFRMDCRHSVPAPFSKMVVGDELRSLHSRAPAASNPLVLIRVASHRTVCCRIRHPPHFFYTKKAALSDCRNFCKKKWWWGMDSNHRRHGR